MDEELEDLFGSLESPELFWHQVSNSTRGYYQKGTGWVYHEGTLYEQLFQIVSHHKQTVLNEDYEEVIEEIPTPTHYTDLLMLWLLDGDYMPERINPAISNRLLYVRKRKQRDIDRDQKRQMKRLSRWVIIPA